MIRMTYCLISGDKDCDAPAKEGSVEAIPLHECQELGGGGGGGGGQGTV